MKKKFISISSVGDTHIKQNSSIDAIFKISSKSANVALGVSEEQKILSLDKNIIIFGSKAILSSDGDGIFINDSEVSQGITTNIIFQTGSFFSSKKNIIKSIGKNNKNKILIEDGAQVHGNIDLTSGENNMDIYSGADLGAVGQYQYILGNGSNTVNLYNFTSSGGINPAISAANWNNTVNLVNSDISISAIENNLAGFNHLNLTSSSILQVVPVSESSFTDVFIDRSSLLYGSELKANVKNNGTLSIDRLNGSKPLSSLTINGNYASDNGHLLLRTVLGDDNSKTDKLIITGDTAGSTLVNILNVGGTGAKTIDGISVIEVKKKSDGVFIQDGRIVAGAYDYSLVKGNTSGTSPGSWFLTSKANSTNPDQKPDNDAETLRPESGSYITNLAAANTMFNTRLHDRLGKTQYTDALTGEEKMTAMWMRQVGGHNNWRDNSGQLKTQSNRYVIQIGGDIARWSTDGLDRWHLGIMTGYGHDSSRTRSSATGYSSKGSVNGYSVGTYATWYANDTDHSGLYADTWLQYSWFNNDVNGEGLASESYRSQGLTASAETGYTQKLTEFTGSKGSRNEWFVQPQAQITLMDVRADDHRENNGTRVKGKDNGNIRIRLGIRTYLKGHTHEDDGKDRKFQPFIEANWIHNTRSFSAGMDGVSLSQKGTKNLGEVKVGVEGQINPHLNLWGNVGVQVGGNGYNDSAAILGIRYNF